MDGYDDEQYLKTLKIIGRVKVSQIEVMGKKQLNPILQLANQAKLEIETKIDENFHEDKASILKGLLLGETSEIQAEIKEDFQASNISHVLAISGMHISYIIIGLQLLLKKAMGKNRTKIFTMLVLIFYSFITGFSPSIVRAVIMGVIAIGSGIINRKNDIINSIAISLFCILFYNPFLILNAGLQLSYFGTIGIILFQPTILKIFSDVSKDKKSAILEKLKEIISVSLSAGVMILPILLYHFNIIGIYFLLTNLLVSLVIGPIIMMGFFSTFINVLSVPLNIVLNLLIFISKFSNLPFSKIYIATPSIISIVIYMIVILMLDRIYLIYHEKIVTTTNARVKNLIALFKYKWRLKKKVLKRYIVIGIAIIMCVLLIPKDLKIYFIDVGQGDSTFIVTPHNKTILIDGGGSLSGDFDVGKKTLLPYLLDRGYTSIDYVMISHFDQDHVRWNFNSYERIECEKCSYRETI